MVIHTIGHSTRGSSELLDLLEIHGIRTLADIRRYPQSRRHPHFNSDALERACAARNIQYVHLPELGGMRKPRPDSVNTALRHTAFRGYADHMDSPEFHAGLVKLLRLADDAPTAVMCAEAVWWRCHRALLSDTLVAAGHTVMHITSPSQAKCHTLSEFAHELNGRVTYPGLV